MAGFDTPIPILVQELIDAGFRPLEVCGKLEMSKLEILRACHGKVQYRILQHFIPMVRGRVQENWRSLL